MAAPIVALVGRPNVGKSTLFNQLTQSRHALVADYAGLTRDRIYGKVNIRHFMFTLIDTGGLIELSGDMSDLMREQAELAIEESDLIFFLVDGHIGLTVADEVIANNLRGIDKPVMLVVNKAEGKPTDIVAAEFYALGLGEPTVISALRGQGITHLLTTLQTFNPRVALAKHDGGKEVDNVIRLAVLGRPNVGKSTLVNQMLNEKRMIVFNAPGTTRDSIHIPFKKDGTDYVLIDTAGVRRRSKVKAQLEKLSIVKTLQSLDDAHVALLMLDAQAGICEQDMHLAGLILQSGRALVIAVNKWDDLAKSERQWISANIERRLSFLNFADIHFISALYGRGIDPLFASTRKAYYSAMTQLSTAALNRVLERAVIDHPPPLVKGRRIKFRYAHLGGKNPPRIIIHGNQTDNAPRSYRRYLENTFRDVLKLQGTPVLVEFKQGANPFNRTRATQRKRLAKKQIKP